METQEKKKLSKKEQLDVILKFHEKKIKESNEILVNDDIKACFQYVVNTSGTILLLDDFHAKSINPESERSFRLDIGERLNLLTKFDIKDINRNRESLLRAGKSEGIYGLPQLTFVENLDIKFPVPLKRETLFEKGMREKEETGESPRYNLPENEFDDMLRKDIEKETKANQRVEQNSGIKIPEKRKTKKEVEQDELNKIIK